jgi:hypothetical protein
MRSIKGSTYVMLAAILLAAALPMAAAAQPSGNADQPTLGLFARVEALVAKLWPFTAWPIGLDISTIGTPGSGHDIEPTNAIGKIGIHTDVVGVALPPDDAESPTASAGSSGPHGS